MWLRRKTTAAEFETAALPHMRALYRTAAHLTGGGAEAEDLVQEVYLAAWKSFDRFEPGTNCRAWLSRILFHKLQHLRRRQARSREAGRVADTVPYQPPIPQALTDEELIAAIARLKPEFREVLLLSDVEEFTYKEIAAALEIPVGTVMSRLSRARKQLRTNLAPQA